MADSYECVGAILKIPDPQAAGLVWDAGVRANLTRAVWRAGKTVLATYTEDWIEHMGLREQLPEDLKDAMRAGDAIRRDVLRSLLTAVSNVEIARVNVKDASATRQDLAEADVLDVIRKQVKQRRESADEYRKGGRAELVAREEAEAEILSAYLPAELSRDEIAVEVRAAIAETGASGPAGKAKVMPIVMGKLKGKADGRVINEIVTELLGGR